MFWLKRFRREIYAEVNKICKDYNNSQFEVIGRLQKEVELLCANAYSEENDWWVEDSRCWLRKIYGWTLVDAFMGVQKQKDGWRYRTPISTEWKEVGPDFSDAIKEIEAEEDS